MKIFVGLIIMSFAFMVFVENVTNSLWFIIFGGPICLLIFIVGFLIATGKRQ